MGVNMHFQNFIYPASSFLRIVEKLQLFYIFSECMIQSRITDSSSGGYKVQCNNTIRKINLSLIIMNIHNSRPKDYRLLEAWP